MSGLNDIKQCYTGANALKVMAAQNKYFHRLRGLGHWPFKPENMGSNPCGSASIYLSLQSLFDEN